jgi:hypothetical protein
MKIIEYENTPNSQMFNITKSGPDDFFHKCSVRL